jgi:hypothetical protein
MRGARFQGSRNASNYHNENCCTKAGLAAFLDRWADAELQQGHHALVEKLAFEAEKVRAEVRS